MLQEVRQLEQARQSARQRASALTWPCRSVVAVQVKLLRLTHATGMQHIAFIQVGISWSTAIRRIADYEEPAARDALLHTKGATQRDPAPIGSAQHADQDSHDDEKKPIHKV